MKIHSPQSDDYRLWHKFYTSIWAGRASIERRTKDDGIASSAAHVVNLQVGIIRKKKDATSDSEELRRNIRCILETLYARTYNTKIEITIQAGKRVSMIEFAILGYNFATDSLTPSRTLATRDEDFGPNMNIASQTRRSTGRG